MEKDGKNNERGGQPSPAADSDLLRKKPELSVDEIADALKINFKTASETHPTVGDRGSCDETK